MTSQPHSDDQVGERDPTPDASGARRLPLEGLQIIELANIVAGPSVGKYLSDFGAEVIKVERPGEGDSARNMGTSLGERSAWWLVLGRNKKTVTLDLSNPEGRDVLLRLVREADALVESFRPGVLERLNLSPDVLLAENPQLVVVRVSGFGQTGPYAHRPGFGTLAEAYSGYAAMSGYEDRPPLLAPTALADEVSGLFATWALMVALYGRDVRGLPGQTIDVSLFESVFGILGPLPALFQHTGYLQPRRGSRLPFSSPRNVYRTCDGAYFAVSGTAPAAAERIIQLVGGEKLLADPRFATHEARGEHADELDEIVAVWVAEHTVHEIEALFESAAVAGIRVMSMNEIFDDPHYAARDSMVRVPDAELGDVAMAAPVPRFSVTPGRIKHAGSRLGSDTRDLLNDLGYQEAEVERMHAEGVW